MSLLNTGDEDLANIGISIVGKDGEKLLDAGDILTLDDVEPPTSKLEDGRLNIKFPLLKKGESVAFWVRTKSNEMPVARASQKGVTVVVPEKPDDGFPWEMLTIMSCGLFLGIILGAMLSEAGNKHVLRKIGFDPKEIQEAYLKSANKSS
jgi:hypothetical protein